ncbi:MAG: rhodanese-like domain-containing protein [Actinomycetes bacterium]|jgi:rhodanese-related sulfurtransferase|nr:rhodanese-like domain-containing protein [Actinomycetes bacterium]
MKKMLYVGLVLALVVACFAVIGCSEKKEGTGVSTATGTAKDGNEVAIEKAAIDLVTNTAAGGYQLVNTETLKQWVDAAEPMTVIDTMPADSFAKGHIPGSVNAELPKEGEATQEQLDAFAALLPADKAAKVVVYCGFTQCPRSNIGASYAVAQGWTNVYRYPGGIVAWTDAGYPTEQ